MPQQHPERCRLSAEPGPWPCSRRSRRSSRSRRPAGAEPDAGEATAARELGAIQCELVDPTISRYGGRIFALTPSRTLVEFAEVGDRGALRPRDPARHGGAQPASLPPERRIQLRDRGRHGRGRERERRSRRRARGVARGLARSVEARSRSRARSRAARARGGPRSPTPCSRSQAAPRSRSVELPDAVPRRSRPGSCGGAGPGSRRSRRAARRLAGALAPDRNGSCRCRPLEAPAPPRASAPRDRPRVPQDGARRRRGSR